MVTVPESECSPQRSATLVGSLSPTAPLLKANNGKTDIVKPPLRSTFKLVQADEISTVGLSGTVGMSAGSPVIRFFSADDRRPGPRHQQKA